jgi:anaerobic selenocysteine-containing dehydrogenase
VIPKIIYSDAYSSEMVAYADLILPDTTYLERHDCISLLDRPISSRRRWRFDPLAGGRAGPRRARLPDCPARSRRTAETAGHGR